MILYVSIFLAGAVVAIVLWKIIVRALYWLTMALGTVFAWRIVELVNGQTFTTTYAKPIFVGAISALVVCMLCSGYIRHTLILFYLRAAIQKDKENASRGKLW